MAGAISIEPTQASSSLGAVGNTSPIIQLEDSLYAYI